MRTIRTDASLFLDVSRQLLAQGISVRFRAGGASMQPAIADGDLLLLEPVEPAAVEPGDVLLYRRGRRGIAHRVVQVRRAGRAVVFLLRGDARATADAPVDPREVLGKVVAVERRMRRWYDRLPGVVRRPLSALTRGGRLRTEHFWAR